MTSLLLKSPEYLQHSDILTNITTEQNTITEPITGRYQRIDCCINS